MNVEHFIQHYGYWALLVGSLLEGEAFCIAAGFFAHKFAGPDAGMTLPGVILVATFGTWLAGQVWFWVGQICGHRIIDRSPDRKARVERIKAWLGKGDALVYTGFHFAFGFRILTPLALGAMEVPPLRYCLFNAAGSLVWAVAFTLVGYYGGRTATHLFGHLHDNEWTIVAGVLILAGVVWLAVRSHQRRRLRGEPGLFDGEADGPPPT